MDLRQKPKNIGKKHNIDHFGIAEKSAALPFIGSHYEAQLLNYPKALFISINLFHDIVDH